MKTLYIVRHAKSSWTDPYLIDHQRPLNRRGQKAAPEMARRLKKRGVRPDAIVSSDALRALETATAMAGILGLPGKAVHKNPAVYNATCDEIVEIVRRFKDDWKTVMVVGHNPTLTELANQFYPHLIENIPTAGIVELRFNVPSWKHIHRDHVDSGAFDFPKNKPSSPRAS
jgi:phosphohistidine phosphatase